MGIPKLFRFLSRHFSKIITKTNPSRSTIEWLGIDFNSLMHPVCASIASADTTTNYKKKSNWPILFKAIIEELKKVIRNTSQNGSLKTVYISIDGVVPMAKIVQQRQRRFRSAYERCGVKTNWDSCLISPGTYFMTEFERYLQQNVKEIKDVRVIISNSREFGEGEHKIMREIRALKCDTNVAIYGLDADLILLSILGLRNHTHITLLRENVHCALREYEKEDYLLVHIRTLWDILLEEINSCVMKHQKTMRDSGVEPTIFTLDHSRIMNDFILLSCYFGNDFLPCIPAVSLSLESSIWFMIEKYGKTLAEEGSYMVQQVTNTVFHWNRPFLLKFWNLCLPEEDRRMGLRTHQWLKRRRYTEKDGERSRDAIRPVEEFYKMPRKKQTWMRNALSSAETYLSVFTNEDKHFNYMNHTIQSTMVGDWLRGSLWVLSYYNGFPVDNFWWYVWSAPPSFMHLIYHHMDTIATTHQIEAIPKVLSIGRRKRMRRPTLQLQAMSIIPPDSEYCIPTKRFGWSNTHHPRHSYTPTYRDIRNIQYSIIWSSWAHECAVHLPLLELPFIVHSISS